MTIALSWNHAQEAASNLAVMMESLVNATDIIPLACCNLVAQLIGLVSLPDSIGMNLRERAITIATVQL